MELARRLPPDPKAAYWSNGSVDVADGWSKGYRARYALDETIANIADNNSLVLLRHAEHDAAYGPVFRDLFARLIELSGPQMRDDVIMGRATILINSPRRVTSYHIDAEVNFLVHIAGHKRIHVFPHDDPAIVTEVELERFHSGNANGAVYKPESQGTATTYDLTPGTGIHVPVYAPHWVQNGDDVSISISVNFDLRSVKRQAAIYRFNSWLRRAGLTPAAPGHSALHDRLKLAAAQGAIALRNAVRPILPSRPTPY